MKISHTTPCAECPWRKASLQGYLGGWEPYDYADTVSLNTIPACHCKDKGALHPETAFCAGAASVMANACIMPHEADPSQEGAVEMVKAVGRRDDTFAHPKEFYEYHSHGDEWVSPFIRALSEAMEG